MSTEPEFQVRRDSIPRKGTQVLFMPVIIPMHLLKQEFKNYIDAFCLIQLI